MAYNFKDITVDVNLQNQGTCTGVLIGSGPCFNAKATVNFENCVNKGMITGTSFVGFLYGNPSYIDCLEENGSTITVSNCTTEKMISSNSSTNVAFALGAAKSPAAAALNDTYQQADMYQAGGNCLDGKAITVTQNADASKFAIAINDDSNYTYKLAMSIAATYWTKDNEAWTDDDVAAIPASWDTVWDVSNGLKYMAELSEDETVIGTLNSFHAYDKRTAAKNLNVDVNSLTYNNGYAIVVENGVNYIVRDVADNIYIDSNVSLLVHAYSGKTLVGTQAITIQ